MFFVIKAGIKEAEKAKALSSPEKHELHWAKGFNQQPFNF